MGSTRWSVKLARIDKPATNAVVRRAVVKALADMWLQELTAFEQDAARWVEGKRPPLRIQDGAAPDEPATELTFDFDPSTEWPRELADHWLHGVLVWQRPRFERALAKLGVAVAAWPVERTTHRFVHQDDQVGLIDGHTVRWQLGGTGVVELAGLREPPADATACACLMCKSHVDELALPEARDAKLERVFVGTRVDRVAAPRAGGLVVACGAGWLPIQTWITHDDRTVILDDKRELDLLHEVGRELVAIFHGPQKSPWIARTSRDGGKTWSKPNGTKLPALDAPALHPNPHDAARVWMFDHGKLFASTDGGRTFGKPITPELAGKAPHRVREVLPCGGRLLAQWDAKPGGPSQLVASHHGGKTFVDAMPPGVAPGVGVWGTEAGEVVAIAKAAAYRTGDGARTWTKIAWPRNDGEAALGRRWFVIDSAALHVSDDRGATWRVVVEARFDHVFHDGADPSCCYVSRRGALFHVVM